MDRFAELLRARPEIRIKQSVVWDCFHRAFPHRPYGPEPTQWLHSALLFAQSRGIIRLPPVHGKRWDRHSEPPIPKSVDRIQERSQPRHERWRDHPWHPLLEWVADFPRLGVEQESFLLTVDRGFAEGRFDQTAALKYRSLELTHDEKRLGEIAKGVLFGPGRLTLELLNCVPDTPPLAWEPVGDKPAALVFENVGAFVVARDVLRSMSDPPYGIVACGGGNAFAKSIQQFWTIGRPVCRIEYLGDIDRPGLRIPRSANRTAAQAGLPEVLPAEHLHRAMLDAVRRLGHPAGLPYRKAARISADDSLLIWLPENVRKEVTTILAAGRRVPEETLGAPDFHRVWNST